MNWPRLGRITVLLSFLLFPISFDYFSPYFMTSGLAQGIITMSLLVWAAWFVSSLALGRAACGYVCPLGGAQMVKDETVPKDLRPIRYIRALKYVLWAAWMAAALVVALSARGPATVDLLYMIEGGVSLHSRENLFTYYFLLVVVLVPGLFLGQRAFCHYLCPFAPFNIIGTKIKNRLRLPSVHLQPVTEQCVQCRKCDQACPMTLQVCRMVQRPPMEDTECILCGTCINTCPHDVIAYRFARPPRRAPASEG